MPTWLDSWSLTRLLWLGCPGPSFVYNEGSREFLLKFGLCRLCWIQVQSKSFEYRHCRVRFTHLEILERKKKEKGKKEKKKKACGSIPKVSTCLTSLGVLEHRTKNKPLQKAGTKDGGWHYIYKYICSCGLVPQKGCCWKNLLAQWSWPGRHSLSVPVPVEHSSTRP